MASYILAHDRLRVRNRRTASPSLLPAQRANHKYLPSPSCLEMFFLDLSCRNSWRRYFLVPSLDALRYICFMSNIVDRLPDATAVAFTHKPCFRATQWMVGGVAVDHCILKCSCVQKMRLYTKSSGGIYAYGVPRIPICARWLPIWRGGPKSDLLDIDTMTTSLKEARVHLISFNILFMIVLFTIIIVIFRGVASLWASFWIRYR